MTTAALTTASLKDILSFPFRGKDWQTRFLIGVGLMFLAFVPFLSWILYMGYFARILKGSIQGEELELPAWEDWGKLATDGLRLLGIYMIYMLPSQIVMFGGMAAYFGGFFILIPIMEATERSNDAMMFVPLLMFALMGVMFLSMALGYLLMLLGAVPLPVALARAVEQEKFSAGFQLSEISRLVWRNKAGYFAAWVVLVGLFALLYFLGTIFYMTFILMWVFFVLLLPLSFYLMTVSAALFGQTYRESLAMQAEAIERVDP